MHANVPLSQEPRATEN